VEESLELARAATRVHVEAIAATPHVRADYPTNPAAMELALTDLRARVDQLGLPLRVLPGAEIAVDQLDCLSHDALRRFGLGGNPSYLLIETPYHGWPLGIAELVFRLRLAGITPVLAHPERSPDVQRDLGRVASLVHGGMLVQVTAASLVGEAGRRARDTGLQLINEGLAHLVATDAHPSLNRAGLDTVADAIGNPGLASWLTHDVPAAILAGRPLPARPTTRAPRRRVLGRR
jgi:protein-tyrosine phosphatase